VGTENQYTRQVDIFAFGLATLELATKHKARAARTLHKPSSPCAACLCGARFWWGRIGAGLTGCERDAALRRPEGWAGQPQQDMARLSNGGGRPHSTGRCSSCSRCGLVWCRSARSGWHQ